jgi:hypothetical protein
MSARKQLYCTACGTTMAMTTDRPNNWGHGLVDAETGERAGQICMGCKEAYYRLSPSAWTRRLRKARQRELERASH